MLRGPVCIIRTMYSSPYRSIAILLLSAASQFALAGTNLIRDNPSPDTQAKATAEYMRLPLTFELNQGQSDPAVKAMARGNGYGLFLTSTESVVVLTGTKDQKPAVLRMQLLVSNPAARILPLDPQRGTVSSYIGNAPEKWQKDIPTFGKMRYEEIYPGVDLVYYGHQGALEYDFILSPGANPKNIHFGVKGADKIRIDRHGDLLLHTAFGDVRHHKPVIYQQIDGVRREIAGHYVMRGRRDVGFEIAEYNPRHELVIDPTLGFSTYTGGSLNDQVTCVAVDKLGNTFIGGSTASTDYPVTTATF